MNPIQKPRPIPSLEEWEKWQTSSTTTITTSMTPS